VVLEHKRTLGLFACKSSMFTESEVAIKPFIGWLIPLFALPVIEIAVSKRRKATMRI
jgi:hypothetical protein